MRATKKLIQSIHRDHGLTPMQRIVFDAFGDGKAQDRVTIASYLDNEFMITRYASLKVVAADVLKQLCTIGLVRVDSDGWHHRCETPSQVSQS